LIERLCACCTGRRISPGDATIEVSDDEPEDWKEPPPADMRITLRIVNSENIKIRDWISGSAPYILIKPDGNNCLRRTFATSAQWLTPNYKFEETFEFDISASELPIRLVREKKKINIFKKKEERKTPYYIHHSRMIITIYPVVVVKNRWVYFSVSIYSGYLGSSRAN
jgi:hypothetical protein